METKFKYIKLIAIIMAVITHSLFGCKKLVEVDLPIDKVTVKAVFNTTSGAAAVLSDIYWLLPLKSADMSVWGGLLADELILHDESNLVLQQLYANSLVSNNPLAWDSSYEVIFRINSVIEGVERSDAIPASAKNELIGQAKFLRAYVYFYLVNLYGGVPLVTTTDYKINMLLPRSSEDAIYRQIKSDLIEAQSLVSGNYLKPDLLTVTTERVTANKAVVTAFLARVLLYTGEWQMAEVESNKVIADSKYSILESLNEVFLKNSKEAIWQIEGNIAANENSRDGTFFIPLDQATIPTVYLSNSLLTSMVAEDKRRHDWLGTVIVGADTFNYPFKYKSRSHPDFTTKEYNMILRLAEQYLIRAEARAHLNNLSGAVDDLNVIRKRAGLSLYTTLDQQALFNAIERERQVEFFSESGHRWFDLKRTNRADAVLAPIKGGSWQPTDKLFPIPVGEFERNPSLRGHQNPGYTEQ